MFEICRTRKEVAENAKHFLEQCKTWEEVGNIVGTLTIRELIPDGETIPSNPFMSHELTTRLSDTLAAKWAERKAHEVAHTAVILCQREITRKMREYGVEWDDKASLQRIKALTTI